MTPAELRARVTAAQAATWGSDKEIVKHYRKHGRVIGLATQANYEALVQDTLQAPERVFSIYYDRLNKPAIRQWVFAKGNNIAVVGEYDEQRLLVTFYPTKINNLVVDLNTYLREDAHGEQLVEIRTRFAGYFLRRLPLG